MLTIAALRVRILQVHLNLETACWVVRKTPYMYLSSEDCTVELDLVRRWMLGRPIGETGFGAISPTTLGQDPADEDAAHVSKSTVLDHSTDSNASLRSDRETSGRLKNGCLSSGIRREILGSDQKITWADVQC